MAEQNQQNQVGCLEILFMLNGSNCSLDGSMMRFIELHCDVSFTMIGRELQSHKRI